MVLRTDQSVTVTAWVKLDAIKSTDQQVLSQNNFHLYNRGADHKWSLNVRKPDGSGGYVSIESLSDVVATPGEWVHLAGVFNAATGDVQLYVNSVRQASTGHGAVGIAPTLSFMIGTRSATNPSLLGGAIDEVHAYQGILNDREIANIYAGI